VHDVLGVPVDPGLSGGLLHRHSTVAPCLADPLPASVSETEAGYSAVSAFIFAPDRFDRPWFCFG
jgi:hypothetical protein